jgi:hypothetical protein
VPLKFNVRVNGVEQTTAQDWLALTARFKVR